MTLQRARRSIADNRKAIASGACQRAMRGS
jgi:hypothetical protein